MAIANWGSTKPGRSRPPKPIWQESVHVHRAASRGTGKTASGLEAEIAEARSHPSIDDLQIVELKRRKLLVKDEIARLQN